MISCHAYKKFRNQSNRKSKKYFFEPGAEMKKYHSNFMERNHPEMKKVSKSIKETAVAAKSKPVRKDSFGAEKTAKTSKRNSEEVADDEDLPEEDDDYEKPDPEDSADEPDEKNAKIDDDLDFDDLDLDDDDEDKYFNEDNF